MSGKQQLIAELDRSSMKSTVPAVKAGHTVRITQKIKEGEKERLQVFEGLVIRVHGKGALNTTITVRKISEGVGVEKIFPIHSPSITDIQIVKVAKVRRSKLYYMRERSGKSARLQETQTTPKQREEMMLHFEELKKETATEDKTASSDNTTNEEQNTPDAAISEKTEEKA
ncbi:50S ribosomal protein L19 [Candidatus Peregrinibacteria bacterium]|jgi:large subunit ribosomal protein L19|nr:50S ribosomal protein L19 [Candidatus Peregrinibacteria bacterium]